MKRIYNVLNLLPVSEILKIEDDPDLMFGEGVYIQMHGHLDQADIFFVSSIKKALLYRMKGKKDYNQRIYNLPGFEFNGI